jgi:ribose transport system substrate-binding protein
MRRRSWSDDVARKRDVAGSVRRALALLVVGAVALLLVAGCGSSDDGDGGGSTTATSGTHKPVTIGLMVFDTTEAFFKGQIDQVQRMVESHGDKLAVLDPAGDPTRQLQLAQDWLNAGKVDAIIGSTVDVNAFQPALDQAAEQAVPVVFLGFEPRQLKRAQATVTQDFKDWGVQIGEAAARCIDDRLGGSGEVAIIDNPGRPGPIVPTLLSGVKEGLATNPGARIVATANGFDDTLKSLQAIQTVRQAHPDVNVVVSHTEASMLGALQAYKVAGIDPKRVCLIGSGGTPQGEAALKSGDFYAQVDIRLPYIYGTVLRAAYALLKNPDDPAYSGRIVRTTVGMNYH